MKLALTEDGLTTDTQDEIVEELIAGYQTIYGDNLDFSSNTPDGQKINLEAQTIADLQEIMVTLYNSFDPDSAVGSTLDARTGINNVQRQQGTFSQVQVNITVDRDLTLNGLDESANDVDGVGYTVSDNNGNKYILYDTTNLTANTTTLLTFRSQRLGAKTVSANTITTPTTIVIGVTGINNPSSTLEVGIDEETDAQLRERRRRSVANSSTGYYDGLEGSLLNIQNVSEVKIYENITVEIDANGVAAGGVWIIVEGGSNTDIANIINQKATLAIPKKGAIVVTLTSINGSSIVVQFDRPLSKNLYIRFNIKETVAGQVIDPDTIKAYMANSNNLSYGIAEAAETSRLTKVAQDAIDVTGAKAVPLEMEVSSDGMTWDNFIQTDLGNEKWLVDAANITISII